MAESDVLFEFGVGIGRAARSAADWLGLGSDPVGEDVAAQVDGTDALYRSIAWAPAVNGKAVTKQFGAGTGKGNKEVPPLFLTEGNDPLELEANEDREKIGKYYVSGLMRGFEPGPGLGFDTVEYHRPITDAEMGPANYPEPTILAIGGNETDFEEFTVYPSFFVTEKPKVKGK